MPGFCRNPLKNHRADVLISEVFESIQGEGPWAGTQSLFLRTSGCNLRCWFCDTPHTSWQPEGEPQSLDQLSEKIAASTAPHVVLTGGEPMLPADIVPLSELCRQHGKVITIETAGTIDQPVACDLMAISPKLQNSNPFDAVWGPRHERTRHQPEVIRALWSRYNAILKFVIDTPADVRDVLGYVAAFPQISADAVWLMPQARSQEQLTEKSGWVHAAAEEHGFRFSTRLHIELFGNQRGT